MHNRGPTSPIDHLSSRSSMAWKSSLAPLGTRRSWGQGPGDNWTVGWLDGRTVGRENHSNEVLGPGDGRMARWLDGRMGNHSNPSLCIECCFKLPHNLPVEQPFQLQHVIADLWSSGLNTITELYEVNRCSSHHHLLVVVPLLPCPPYYY